jgi:DNA polymerase-3 subunit gamma/tau
MSVVREMVSSSSEDQLTLMLSEIMKAETDVRHSSSPRLALEMAMIRASFLSTLKPIKDVLEHLDRYKRQAENQAADKPATRTYREEQPQYTSPAVSGTEVQPEKQVSEPSCVQTAEEMTEVPYVDAVKDETPAQESPTGHIDIKSSWEWTVARIEPPLSSQLVQAGVKFGDGEIALTLDGGHAVFADSITRNIKMIEKILFEESGSRIRITIATTAKKTVRRNSMKEKVMGEPLIREALELFDGRIVDVKPVEKTEKSKNGGRDV